MEPNPSALIQAEASPEARTLTSNSTSAAVREQLIQALELDLVGPTTTVLAQLQAAGELAQAAELDAELLDRSPSRWYQTGFLIPSETSLEIKADDTADDDLAGLDGQNLSRGDQKTRGKAAADDTGASEGGPARKVFFPSSIGLSFLIGQPTDLQIEIHWANYKRVPPPEGSTADQAWQREPHSTPLTLKASDLDPSQPGLNQKEVPTANGLWARWHVRSAPVGQSYPPTAVAVSLFLTNERRYDGVSSDDRDAASAFQVQLNVACAEAFLARCDPRAADHQASVGDWDQRVNNLHYRNDLEFAVGHNISPQPVVLAGKCNLLQTTWLPQATIEKVSPAKLPKVRLAMGDLDELASAGAGQIQAALQPLVDQYKQWISDQATTAGFSPEQQRTASEMLNEANKQAQRIQHGIDLLSDPQVRLAFAIANRVMAQAARQRFGVMEGRDPRAVEPEWRPFQLAFVLMNLVGMRQPESPERETIDLLFFPTGGGKTEAYLGLAAYTLVLRRLRHGGSIHSAGMSVLMRYTLRLLTLDQLGRASTLICALEIERQKDPATLGEWPFEIGLWVGQSGTPNKLGRSGDADTNSARSRVLAWTGGDNKPIPIDNCPWCGTQLGKASLHDDRPAVVRGVFRLLPDADHPTELRVCCRNRQCRFSGDNTLPLVAVDEMLYQRLPAFVIATVDKFAALPWVGPTGKLFGHVSHAQGTKGFSGPGDPPSAQAGQPLPDGLEPPDLIIQDELHLISGPLGSMGGLYEAVIDELCTRECNGQRIRPKVVASTATVRRATQQMRALFARKGTPAIFPAPGPDRRDSFFSKTEPLSEAPGRVYLGISAPGRNQKALLLRVGLALLATGQKLSKQAQQERKRQEKAGEIPGPNPVDPYLTLLGYFNTIKELGITRRLIEEEVTSQLTTYDQRRRLVGDPQPRYAKRKIANEPLELTSRVPTSEVSTTKARLAQRFDEGEPVDTALATNMISVGLDISRLGLMVMLGQPKTTAEYIQASSRVGRDSQRPGLVVVLLNPNRPRDRSHYERFSFWHSVFYRDVEATSVTPFSRRAIERGLPAISVALARHLNPKLTWAKGAGNHKEVAATGSLVAERLGERIRRAAPDGDQLAATVVAQVQNLMDKWSRLADEKGDLLQYGREEGEAPALLHSPLDPDLDELPLLQREFVANWSLRDVEPTAGLFVQRPDSSDEGGMN
ncbi:DISARM system helicase DrmA [Cyanobium sp. HWJ4-Hawea]|uniref:DISARM system helicase DrmA n=1 Tax=Cyanobium sp. HWJ4-Hawea TaxID=2823713 RepID=UPI0020CE91B6|nr:DISARM system helicase DrmA [Cyanobium sp. HWJ4-Hawea]MCP9808693.1 DISARM system helicase DrmA [Cyanobium sp. HWJ4-Hawea]